MTRGGHLEDSETNMTRIPRLRVSNLPGFRLSSEKLDGAFGVHFGHLEDRNAPRMWYSLKPRPSAPHIKRYLCNLTTIEVSGSLS